MTRSWIGRDANRHEAVAFPKASHDDLVDAAVDGADLKGAHQFPFASAPW